ncbi:MAG: hypothetical protein ACUVS5_13030 [Anaerolineae bacterium]
MDERADQERRAVEALSALAELMDISASYVADGVLFVAGVSLVTGRRVTLYLPLSPSGTTLWTNGEPIQC